MKTIELSELMIVAAVEFTKEAEIHGFDSRKESLEDWVNYVGIDLANEIANRAIDKINEQPPNNKQLERLEDEFNAMSEEERDEKYD